MKRLVNGFLTVGLALVLLGAASADAGVVGKAVRRAVTKRAATVVKKQVNKAVRQKLGPIHTLKKPTIVERFTNRPATDKARGLGGKGKHVFTRRPRVGRKGTAEHIKKELNIHHPVKQRQKIVLPPGTQYHERPIRHGEAYSREVIVHGRIPGKAVKVIKEKLPHAKK